MMVETIRIVLIWKRSYSKIGNRIASLLDRGTRGGCWLTVDGKSTRPPSFDSRQVTGVVLHEHAPGAER